MQWVQNGILNRNSLNTLQETADNCITMGNMGRILRKIASQFSNLTAEEWKNWILHFSLIALYSVIPADHYSCWQLFVNACNIFCSPLLSPSDIDKAHGLICQFFIAAENLYGPA